jgi:DNA-binding transcriptional LysR family regulator
MGKLHPAGQPAFDLGPSVATGQQIAQDGFLCLALLLAAIPDSMLLKRTIWPVLKVLPIALPKRPWPVAIVTLKHRTLGPVAQLFINHAREIAGSMKGATKLRHCSAERVGQPLGGCARHAEAISNDRDKSMT